MPSFEGGVDELAPEESGAEKIAPQENAAVVEEQKGLLNRIRELVNSKVQESKFPTKEGLGYESTMGIYGGKLATDESGKMVYDTRGLWSRIDQWGDRILRTFDEHHARDPIRMAWRHPMQFIKSLPFLADSKRYRGTPEQTMENVKRFGLEDMYGAHPWGVEVKNPDIFKQSIGLQDIFRQDLIKSPILDKIDRFKAEGEAVKYMRHLHDTAGGIAEGNAYSFLFTEHASDGGVGKPALVIPTEVYNPDKNISEIEQKSTDLLDFLASVGMEEWRRSQAESDREAQWESVNKALCVALENYGDTRVIQMVESYVKRGRLTLPGDTEALDFEKSKTYTQSRKVFALHNTQRLTATATASTELRRRIIESCESYLTGAKGESAEEADNG